MNDACTQNKLHKSSVFIKSVSLYTEGKRTENFMESYDFTT